MTSTSWNAEEINILLNCDYKNRNKQELLELFPNRTIQAIRSKASKLNISEKHVNYSLPIKWSEEEVNILLNCDYKNRTKKELLELLPNRNYECIKNKADRLKIRKNINEIRTYKLEKILDNTIFNCFIYGLILSDGHLDNNSLIIGLHEKDKEYLENIANYFNKEISYHKNNKSYILKINDTLNVEKLKHLLDVSNRKTYNPPSHFNYLDTKEKLMAFIIGFCDGDGNVIYSKKTKSIQGIIIKLHKNWKNILIILQKMLLKMYNIKCTVNDINNTNCSSINIYRKQQLKIFQDFILKHNIPCLKRKWLKHTNHEFDYEQQKWILKCQNVE